MNNNQAGFSTLNPLASNRPVEMGMTDTQSIPVGDRSGEIKGQGH